MALEQKAKAQRNYEVGMHNSLKSMDSDEAMDLVEFYDEEQKQSFNNDSNCYIDQNEEMDDLALPHDSSNQRPPNRPEQ